MTQENSWINKGFFLLTGIISLLLFNAILNFSEFFDLSSPGSIFYMTSANCIGGVVSFIVSSAIGKNFSKVLKIYTLGWMSLAILVATFGFALAGPKGEFGKWVLTILSLVGGIATSWFQSLVISIAAEVSSSSIRNFNLGSGLIGVIITFICFVLNSVLPTRDAFGLVDLANIKTQIVIFIFISIGCFIIFFVLLTAWLPRAPHFHDMPEDAIVETKQTGFTGFWYIFPKSVDINLGILINFLTTLNIVGFWVYTSYKTFYTPNSLSLPFYFLAYNIGDTLSKGTPVKLLPSSSTFAHALNIIKILANVYFFYTVIVHTQGALVAPAFRLFLILIIGLLNGYLTNAYMVLNGARFAKPRQRGAAAYNNVFFLLTGLALGSFLSLLL